MPAQKVSFTLSTSSELTEEEIAEAKVDVARFAVELGIRFGEPAPDALLELPVRWEQK